MVFSLFKLILVFWLVIMKPKVQQGKTESNKAGSIKSSFFGKATNGMWNILAYLYYTIITFQSLCCH